MVRVIIKGGVWKNTEDEILKAAIMKYGKNQWSRIASLLHRKSSKQCKARWQEWLDPRIKKTEWSREEDEKLLHLAKIMPTQWRTIAPVVGRTAAQCLERYEQLLDEAQRRAEGLDEGEALREAKKLKPGEVDPTPETKPARPDPIDMDEDELEMLSEARARLANTQGKKAKRKARERQLAEARRLASLQKRRELRAAGIYAGNGVYKLQKKGIIDYNAEIPFEKPVPAGFHDPSDDVFDKNSIQQRVEKRRDQVEAEERRKDKKKVNKRRAEDNPESIFEKKHDRKRSKLVLPEPQVSDKELEDIVKIGQASDSIRDLIDENPTSTLLHNYSEAFNHAQAARTMRTPAALSDSIARAADDLLAITNAETPLLGGKNAPLHTTDFTAPSSIRAAIQTPNTVLAAIAHTPKQLYDRTPGTTVSATPVGATPFRDELNINRDAGRATVEELRKALKNLPTPKNDFEVVMPDDEEQEEEDMDVDWADDAGELDLKRAALLEKKKAKALALRTEAFRRKLPIPSRVNDAAFKRYPVKNEFDEADNLIRAEMRVLLHWDVNDVEPKEKFSIKELEAANALIDQEAARHGPFDEDFYMTKAVSSTSGRKVIVGGRAYDLNDLPEKEQVKSIKTEIEGLTTTAKKIKTKSEKTQNKLKVILQGYEKIEDQAVKDISKYQHESIINAMEVATFSELRHYEVQAARQRLERLELEVMKVHKIEAELQQEFSDLAHQQWVLNQTIIRKGATTESAPVAYVNGISHDENGAADVAEDS